MEMLIECVLRHLVAVRKDVFGENCTFSSFEEDSNNNFDPCINHESLSRFGRIVLQRNGKNEYSDDLFVKVSDLRMACKGFTILGFSNEAFFHTRIAPFFATYREISYLFPKYYDSLLPDNLNADEAVLIYENIQSKGYKPLKTKSFLDYDHLKLMMRKLGEFHAYSYLARQKDPDKFYELSRCYHETNAHHNIVRVLPNVLAAMASRGYSSLLNHPFYNSKIKKLGLQDRLAAEVYDEAMEYALTGDQKNPTHVLCHGDFLSNNVLFLYNVEKTLIDLKMVDLATWRFASPVVDLGLVLYFNTDQRMRNENWNNLIDEYYAAVRNTFPSNEIPSKDTILAEFKKRALFTYFLASFYLPFLVSIDNGGKLRTELADDSPELTEEYVLKLFGGEEVTIILTDIFQDMIDRGFL